MVEANTLQEIFPISYLGPSPSLQESESTVDSTIDIPDILHLSRLKDHPLNIDVILEFLTQNLKVMKDQLNHVLLRQTT